MPELSNLDGVEMPPMLSRIRAAFRAFAPKLGFLFLFLLAGWFIFNWYATVQRTLRCYTPIPMFDYWRTAAFLHFYQAFDLTVLWRQHNDHRIVFPEIVFATDLLLLHGRELLPISLSFLCHFGSWLVLAWAFWSVKPMSVLLRITGALLSGIIIGWQGSASIIVSPFLLQWTLTQIAVLLSLAFLTRLKETAGRAYLSATIVSAVVATYSSSNGLTLWPILIGMGFLLSIRRRQMFVLVLAGALFIGVYFIGYKFSGSISIVNLIRHPVYFVEFIGSYLSMPFGALKSAQFGMRLGVASLCIVAMLAIDSFRTRLLLSRSGVVLFGCYLFLLMTAMLTAAGRMDAADPGFGNAKPARYVSGPLVSWGIFMLLCLWAGSRLRWRKAAAYTVAFVFSMLLLAGLPKLRWWLWQQDAEFADAQLAALAMEEGVYDPNVILGIFPDPVSAQLWSRSLRENQLSVFYKGHGKWLGRPAQQFAGYVATQVPGEVSYNLPVRDGVEVAGWFDTSKLSSRNSGWVLLVNETGTIVGFGRRLPAGFPDSIGDLRTPPSLGWVGFISLMYPVKTFSAYLIEKRGLLLLQRSVAVPRDHVTDRTHAGPLIPGIQWRMDSTWAVDKVPAHVPFREAPAGPVYASWSDNDANTGRLTSSIFPVPRSGCLILPVLQGPRANGLSVDLLDADTNQVVASSQFKNGPTTWTFWRMTPPAETKRLRIVAEDQGKDWGEWLAVANPNECK